MTLGCSAIGPAREHDDLAGVFDGDRFLFVFPHPDDEIFSCLALMRRLRLERPAATIDAMWVAPLPAPRDISTRDSYDTYTRLLAANFRAVRARLGELFLTETFDLPIRSREVHLSSEVVYDEMKALVGSRGYTDVLCCSLEGGHPDHDVACVVTAAVVRTTKAEVRATEYALYHGGATGEFTNNSFLATGEDPGLVVPLTGDDIALKRDLRGMYSAEPTLAAFAMANERFRAMRERPSLAPYDRATLHYETWDSHVDRADVRACMDAWVRL